MDNNESQLNENLPELLLNSLNEQGYLFQEACKYELDGNLTGWTVRAFEYPVSIHGQDTKIDIVLHANRNPDKFAIVECKRADPIYSCWLFGSPKLEKCYSPYCSVLNLECTEYSSNSKFQAINQIKSTDVDVPSYVAGSWLEVKVKTRSNSGRTSNPQNIENAFAQVLRGISGFAQEQYEQRSKSPAVFSTFFFPIVVTTASLYMAGYDVKDIDISTGKIEKEKVAFGTQPELPEEQKWVLVHYGAAENIATCSIPSIFHDNDPKQLARYKNRSIFIVNSNHLVEFFRKLGAD